MVGRLLQNSRNIYIYSHSTKYRVMFDIPSDNEPLAQLTRNDGTSLSISSITQNIYVFKESIYIQRLYIYAASRDNIYSTSRK